MQPSFFQIIISLLAAILFIVVLTAKYRVPPFFALLLACFIVGAGVQMPVLEIVTTAKEGFGNIMKSLALVIIIGTTLGILLEHTGSTMVMAAAILNITGKKRAPLAMSITGFIVGLPIFCDSGYIVLSGLNKSLARRTGLSIAATSGCLATGLYAVHCLIPPHPGASAAASIMNVDFGKLIVAGMVIAVPTAVVGYLWSLFAAKKYPLSIPSNEATLITESDSNQPSVVAAFLPVVIPILLIGIRAFMGTGASSANVFMKAIVLAGDPVLALSIGVLLAFNCGKGWSRNTISRLLHESAEKAGGILVIIGGGGAFGAVLAATKIGGQLSSTLPLAALGIFFPFLVTLILKTAQGSSTVAIITAASIVLPTLPAIGLASEQGRLLCVLSMGAGSMMISHANDAYFWVIAKFSGLEMDPMLRVYSVATVLMGLTSMAMTYILSKILL